MSTTRTTAELRFFRSEFFKIVLKDVKINAGFTTPPTMPQKSPSSIQSTNTSTRAGDPTDKSDNPVFFIHKALLSTLSPELFKHANNTMKEGREGVLKFSEVHEVTMEAFMEWAYYKDYSVSEPNCCSALLTHTKVYVFGDRFNTKSLQDLAFNKLTALLIQLGMIADQKDVSIMMEAVEYAYDNLLLRTTSETTAGGAGTSIDVNTAITSMERLLRYFAQYTSWALDVFRGNEVFRKLMATSADFSEAFVLSTRPAAAPPWVLQVTSGGLSSSNADNDGLASKFDDEDHPLHRYCESCGYSGVMSIKCISCSKFDHDIGTKIELYSTEIGTIGKSRVTGEKSSYTYTCKWCDTAGYYPNNSQYYNGYSIPQYNFYLCCRRCNLEGSSSHIRV